MPNRNLLDGAEKRERGVRWAERRIAFAFVVVLLTHVSSGCDRAIDPPGGVEYKPCTFQGACGGYAGCWPFAVPADGGVATVSMCTNACTSDLRCAQRGVDARCVGWDGYSGRIDPTFTWTACLPLCGTAGECPTGLVCTSVPYGSMVLAACLPPP